MNLKNMKYMFLLMMSVMMLASCSEDDNSYDEYANWQVRNEQAFADTLAYAKQQGEANGWYVYRCWSLVDQTPNKDTQGNTLTLTYKDEDNIVVHVLDKGEGSGCPMYTDSVKVSYRGRLLPTTDENGKVSEGYVFDTTFDGTYNKSTAQLTKFAVGGLIDGFVTALLKMHIGDHWMVYIPHQLGYGASTSNSSIPAYSMLRFEIVLDSYYHAGVKVPDSRAAQRKDWQGAWITE